MLFGSLFKADKGISLGKGRKRKLTVKDVIANMDKVDLATANCTLIRDSSGNEKVEDYGQVDVFRVNDEAIYAHEGGFCITTPSGMKLRSGVGGDSTLAEIISVADGDSAGVGPEVAGGDAGDASPEEEEIGPEDQQDRDENDIPPGEGDGEEEGDKDDGFDPDSVGRPPGFDAFSERGEENVLEPEAEPEAILGLGEAIRLRFFFQRIPYEVDCQIVDRFNPSRIHNVDLNLRFGVGYVVKPLGDVKKREKRRYVRYTHRIGFGHLRIRSEIQFNVYAHRTNIEIPESGAIQSSLKSTDFEVYPYGSRIVTEVQGAEKAEDIVEFFMTCMVHNVTERRNVYVTKPYLDKLRKCTLVGMNQFGVVGAQQTTILPKIFIKKQAKGKSILERQIAAKSGGARDTRKLRLLEEMTDRYSMLTREQKIWNQRSRGKSVVGNFENERGFVCFSSAYGLSQGDVHTSRQLMMPVEVTDIGVENVTLKPIAFEDMKSHDQDDKEFVRQEDGFQVELLNFGVGGVEIRGSDVQEKTEAFLQYLVGETYDEMPLVDRVEALQKYAVLLHLYPVLSFVRHEIADYEPYTIPFRIPVIARVARFRTAKTRKDDSEPQITSIGFEFLYNPLLDSYSRDIGDYDQWEQIGSYTENQYLIEIHKSIQLLFGHDKAVEEAMREGDSDTKKEEEPV